jgi:adenylate cyclase
MAGIEVHANVIHTLLSGQGIHRTTPRAVWGLIALAVLLTAPLFWRAPVWAVLPGGLLLAALWIGACHWAFARGDWQLPLVPVVFALALNGAGLSLARLRAEGQQKRYVQDVFGRYVSPQVLEVMLADPAAVELGGRRREVTVLFSDIRGFTEMSEKMEPEQVTGFLNLYLGEMVKIIHAHGGSIDKYIGDGIMAVWNWHIKQPDHALRAVRAAIAMQEAVASTSPQWREGGGAIRVGIGVHTGPAILGNIGSPRRMERTAIGDTVNVTSRLEALNKTLGPKWNTGVLLSQTTKEAMGVSLVHADYRLQNVGATEIRGRTESLEIHAIIRQDAKE